MKLWLQVAIKPPQKLPWGPQQKVRAVQSAATGCCLEHRTGQSWGGGLSCQTALPLTALPTFPLFCWGDLPLRLPFLLPRPCLLKASTTVWRSKLSTSKSFIRQETNQSILRIISCNILEKNEIYLLLQICHNLQFSLWANEEEHIFWQVAESWMVRGSHSIYEHTSPEPQLSWANQVFVPNEGMSLIGQEVFTWPLWQKREEKARTRWLFEVQKRVVERL